jgi:hypothetical protein
VLVRDGFRVTALQPFDMFPQTFHVETVAVLDRGTLTTSTPAAAAAP